MISEYFWSNSNLFISFAANVTHCELIFRLPLTSMDSSSNRLQHSLLPCQGCSSLSSCRGRTTWGFITWSCWEGGNPEEPRQKHSRGVCVENGRWLVQREEAGKKVIGPDRRNKSHTCNLIVVKSLNDVTAPLWCGPNKRRTEPSIITVACTPLFHQ